MQAVGFAASHVGRRSNNEDSFCIAQDLGLYVVADGMGGHEGGEVASRMAVEAVEQRLFHERESYDDLDAAIAMTNAVRTATEAIAAHAIDALHEMGTTLAAVWFRDGKAVIAHVGDSRVYRMRRGVLTQLTRDHSMINELEAQGNHQLANLLRDRISHVVTRCISAGCNAEPDVRVVAVEEGDVFLLCSDGLSDVLTDREMERILRAHAAENAGQQLVERAYQRGGTDNITAVVVEVPARADA